MTTPYHYLLAGTAAAGDLVDDLCTWHNRMVAHLRRHGASAGPCDCVEPDDCPRRHAVDLYRRARLALGDGAEQLTFLRQTAGGPHA